ncbi:MAE_28990/MAE_18760 family HEPN-like nuclease [Nonomuraea jabiensis]|uniref:MAE_28990/MAE_18760 family HEPN-like nuclease n=1 Tax=Nonomuraea jabiensis TaxID=882448 RepID=UPI0034469EC6
MLEILRSAQLRFDDVVSVLKFDEKLQTLAETRESSRRPEWRRLIYSGAIINIYGSLEQFIDDIIARYATLCAAFFPEYSLLPEKLKAAHDSQARQLLTRDSGGRLSRDDIDEMLRCLASCLDGGASYSLSGIALSFHDRNLKAEVIEEMLARINVAISGPMRRLEIKGTNDSVLTGLYKDTESILSDLVTRRNEIAHGDYSNLLSSEILEAIVEVLKLLVQVIFDEIRKATFLHLNPDSVGYVKNYFAQPNAHLVELTAAEISVGDMIFGIEKGSSRLRAATVISLQDDGTEADCLVRDALRASDGCIGLTLSPRVVFASKIHSLNAEIAELLVDSHFETAIN